MKITFISDTHCQHYNLSLGSGDMLIHCGDFSKKGALLDVASFSRYLAKQDFKYKIVIAGNHDFCFEDQRKEEAEKLLTDSDVIYLNDSGITIKGIKIWGSPVQPAFYDWAFNRKRGAEIQAHWKLIPNDTDILLTHGPAFGILDLCRSGERVGCDDLLATIQRIKPKIHAFGHIHESYGMIKKDGTTFINACNANEYYRIQNLPINFEI
ncbi:MAG: metallophosphatase domain-containing protein [Cocleimonas sp.]|nr:metallophosphatase domain-containing protein [Cocleimonas sp.]